jgi:hypothetical protein
VKAISSGSPIDIATADARSTTAVAANAMSTALSLIQVDATTDPYPL